MIDRRKPIVFLFLVLAIDLSFVTSSKKATKSLVENVADHKDLKKLLRTKNNVFVIFSGGVKASAEAQKILGEVADSVKGLGTVAAIDCAGDGKKLCKKLKVNTGSYVLKHYKDGDFHKDYDRNVNVQSIVNFLKDPTGDLPWNEDSAAADVVHIANPAHFNKFFKQVKGKVLTMFYAPWCGHCKRMKPDYQAAATELKGEAMLAALDASKPENAALKDKYNVTGFPTLLFFDQGTMQYAYPGGNDKKSIMNFLKDPKDEVIEKPVESAWADEKSEVVHLTDATFDTFMGEESSALIMFYAPWCGHCKKAKPHFTKASEKMKNDGIAGKLAAVDCTKENAVCSKFGVKGYPSIKYFKDGELAFEAGQAREEESIIKFMKDPQEPPPPPPPEPAWSDEVSDVVHLTDETFKPFLKKKKHVLVMFYAPWCGHCKRAKPEFAGAAAEYAENTKVEYAAVDCTIHRAVCSTFGVSGYPTIKYFHYLNKEKKDYEGGRLMKDFISFMADPQSPFAGQPPPPPPAWADEKSEVVHLTDASFDTFMGKETSVLVMFYAPWCGHCKNAKPHFTKASEKMKIDGIAGKLAAVDCTKENAVCTKFGVNGYPSIKYFKDGEFAFEQGGARTEESILKFMKDPQEPPPPPPPERAWADEEGEVVHLTDATFDTFMEEEDSALVMFYAPWCGHCKRAKPHFTKAAEKMKNDGIAGKLAAVDCTKDNGVCKKFGVNGYPSIKYFKDGEFAFEQGGARTEESILKFMKDPQEAPPPPPPEPAWADEKSEIVHLTDATFDTFMGEETSVLVMFYAPWCGHCKNAKPHFTKASEKMKIDGIAGKLAAVDCTKNNAVCNKFGVNGYPTIKYFKDGEFAFEQGKARTEESIIKFMKNPQEPPPPPPPEPAWADEKSEVVHLTVATFDTFMGEETSVLVMFYAPWCGHCKNAKPHFTKASEKMKIDGIAGKLAAVDCTKENAVCNKFGVNGYPTIKYFKDGEFAFEQGKARTEESIIKFMKNPQEPPPPPPPEPAWADEKSEVVHLTDATFDTFIGEETSVLVMFYAPWCGHCKNAKPHFTKASEKMKIDGIAGTLAAVDCTKENAVCKKFGVNGYPTIKYFKDGEFAFEQGKARTEESIIKFMKNPQEPPPPPPPEPAWSEEVSNVIHLTEETFKPFLKKKQHVLVMFYAPWCGHCKRAKPEYAGAAAEFAENPEVELAAVDCTIHSAVCSTFEVRGYPTIKYFHYLNKDKKDYEGGRTKKDFISFMSDPLSLTAGKPPPPPTPEDEWKAVEGSIFLKHLNSAEFEEFLQYKDNVLIMFYAPWCGHCKRMKPDYAAAAKQLTEDQIPHVLATVDATLEPALAKKYGVQGYPTLKWFRKGEMVEDYNGGRIKDDIINYIKKQHKKISLEKNEL